MDKDRRRAIKQKLRQREQNKAARIWAKAKMLGGGPGTELEKILKSIGIDPKPKCGCNEKAAQMDVWGITGCEEHFDEIVTWLRKGERKWGWKDKLRAALKMAVAHPLLAISLDPTDPFPGLLRAAISAAKQEQRLRLREACKQERESLL